MSVAEVAGEGDRARTLAAMRDRLASLMDEATPRDAAALARQLASVIKELDALTPKARNPVDDLAAKRARRRGAAAEVRESS